MESKKRQTNAIFGKVIQEVAVGKKPTIQEMDEKPTTNLYPLEQ